MTASTTPTARSSVAWPRPAGQAAAASRCAVPVPAERRARGWRALALAVLYPLRVLAWEAERGR
jgi:hypothetical protein